MSRHVTGVAYVSTFVLLLVLATVSLLISFLHWEPGGLAVSIAIAAVKALLVLWFFMHLAEQRASSRMVVFVSVTMILLLVFLASADVATRHTFPVRPRPPASEGFYGR